MKVSVIIPAYNSERFISRAVRSAIDQDLSSDLYEIIVVNDGSTDNTKTILDLYKNKIKIINHEKNYGLPTARNTGIKNACGRYILNLDSDDYIDSTLLSIGCKYLDLNPDIDAVSFDYILVDDREKHISRCCAGDHPIACGIFFRMEQLIEIGLYDTSFKLREEEDLMIRFKKKYSVYNVILPLYRYRKHNGNITNNLVSMKNYKQKLNEKHK